MITLEAATRSIERNSSRKNEVFSPHHVEFLNSAHKASHHLDAVT